MPFTMYSNAKDTPTSLVTSADSWRKCIHPGPNVNKSPWTCWPSKKRNARSLGPDSDVLAAVFLAAIAARAKSSGPRAAHGRHYSQNHHLLGIRRCFRTKRSMVMANRLP